MTVKWDGSMALVTLNMQLKALKKVHSLFLQVFNVALAATYKFFLSVTFTKRFLYQLFYVIFQTILAS